MKNHFLLSGSVAVFCLFRVTAAVEHVLYVSPSAGTIRDGSSEHPFATPQEAQASLRTRLASGERVPWVVSLAEGEYPLTKPFTLVPEDSGTPGAPILWRGPVDGSAKFVGARELKGWRVRPDGRWEADVPIEQKHRFQVAVWFEQLYVNGCRAKRARYPNEGFLHAKGAKPTLLAGDTELMELFVNRDELAPLATCSSFAHLRLAHLVVHHKWSATRRPIRGYDAERGVVFTEGRSVTKWNTWDANSTYYIENAPFALDEPGEWMYDGVAKKVLYIPRPGETLENTRFQFPEPGLVNLLRIAGDPAKEVFVHDLVFENIVFAFSDSPRRLCFKGRKGLSDGEIGDDTSFGPSEWPGGQAAAHTSAAVLADGAHRIELRGCSIVYAGEYGVWFREGCVSNRIERCSIVHPGAGGIRIGTTAAPQGIGKGVRVIGLDNGRGTGWNVIDDCVIAHGGRIFAEGVGVWIGHSPFNSVTHCEIADFYYTGVSIGWVWGYAGSLAQGNTLAFCRIHDIGQCALSDMGGVYTLGTSYGTCVTNNVIYNVDSRSYGGWGLYPDEGSEGIVFENNLVYDTKDSSFHQHYGKDNILRNNILAFSREGQIALSRAEPHLSFTAERNIIYWANGPVFTKYQATLKETGRITWKDNFWWMQAGTPSFNSKTFAQWQEKGNDRNGLVADPLFIDVQKRDFRLRENSPVIKAGFRPFDPSKAGVRPHAPCL
ncbi:MAG: right-handed parallel beta-helix repeat-containing protein [Kiritimatiellae bacterium]|nr:right-handed parallel beta-helix repeat-containing protein [Kiritimatiellia bacterium]